MSEDIIVWAVAPSLFNPNGDAENARVLARRAEWVDLPARVVMTEPGEAAPERADAVVIGSCSDSARPAALEALNAVRLPLRDRKAHV